MNLDDLIATDKAVIPLAEAAELFDLGKTAAWEASKRGEIPTIRVGRRLLCPVPKLRALLGVETPPEGPRGPGPPGDEKGPGGGTPGPEALNDRAMDDGLVHAV